MKLNFTNTKRVFYNDSLFMAVLFIISFLVGVVGLGNPDTWLRYLLAVVFVVLLTQLVLKHRPRKSPKARTNVLSIQQEVQ